MQRIVEVVAKSDSIQTRDDAAGPRIGRIFALPGEDPAAERSVCLERVPKEMEVEALRQAMLSSAAASAFGPIVAVRRMRDLASKDRSYSVSSA